MDLDKSKYKIYTWKNWMVLHWILNPGLMINELILGQRIATISVVDKTSDKPLFERTYIPCPHCDKIHDGRTWSTINGTAFKNWFGLYCPSCGKIIPCVMNVFTWLILTLTYPFWGWFRESLKAKWLKKQPQRFENLDPESIPHPTEGKKWVIEGVLFGMFLFFMNGIFFIVQGNTGFTFYNILLGFVICIFGGLLYCLFMKLYLNKRGKPSEVN